MSERIDQKFITAIVAAHRVDTLEITENDSGGAVLEFMFLGTAITMHLARRNWEIVREAIAVHDDSN